MNEEYDLQASDGAIMLGDTQEQNAALIVDSEKGEWKEHPQMGAGLRQLVKSQGTGREIIRQTNVALQFDGIAAEVTINDGRLTVRL